MSRMKISALVVVALGVLGVGLSQCQGVRKSLVTMFTPEYLPPGGDMLEPIFDKNDVDRPKIPIRLTEVGSGFIQPVGLEFVPGDRHLALVLEKAGPLKWCDLNSQTSGLIRRFDVIDDSEQGLLGLAFHPAFEDNGRFFVNYTLDLEGVDTSRVEEWRVTPKANLRTATPTRTRTILELVQPYQNHNGGGLLFGPDGLLYIGFGDGGWRNDPEEQGEDPTTWLGSMLRIDVDGAAPYVVPDDNPFVGKDTGRPEVWAYGLRNPWRYAFDGKGRMIVGDVGQDDFEEITFLERGANAGWNTKEGHNCFPPGSECSSEGLLDPIWSYGRDDGGSVTGGFVVTNNRVPDLEGKYVFGDFLSGRIWALDLPSDIHEDVPSVYALGRWPALIASFARDQLGNLYVVDFPNGRIFRIDPPA